jgi:hypothetical protein
MNRRGFISLLAGAAGAPIIPWRGLEKALIFLPSAAEPGDFTTESMKYVATYNYRTHALAHSLIEMKEVVAARILSAVNFREILLPGLERAWDAHYNHADYIDLFK